MKYIIYIKIIIVPMSVVQKHYIYTCIWSMTVSIMWDIVYMYCLYILGSNVVCRDIVCNSAICRYTICML